MEADETTNESRGLVGGGAREQMEARVASRGVVGGHCRLLIIPKKEKKISCDSSQFLCTFRVPFE
jgi:hypothetical protein